MMESETPKTNQEHNNSSDSECKELCHTFDKWKRDPNGWIAICTICLVIIGVGALYISHDTEKRQLRAYVTLTNIQSDSTGMVLNVEFNVDNFGQTPAKNCTIIGDVKILPFPLPARYNFQIPTAPFEQKTRVDPRVNYPLFVPKSYVFNNKIKILAKDPSKRFYAFGVLTYEDIFNDVHSTNYCYFMELDPTPKKDRPGRPARTFKWADCDQHTDFN